MTYTPADVPGFMGLDLADVEDARGAIEATDCYVDPDGTLVPRKGYTHYGSGTSGTGSTGSLAFNASTTYTNLITNPDLWTATGWEATNAATDVFANDGALYVQNKSASTTDIGVQQSATFSISASTRYVFGFTFPVLGGFGPVTVTPRVSWYQSTTLLSTASFTTRNAKAGGTFQHVTAASPSTATHARLSFVTDAWVKTESYFNLDSVWFTEYGYTGGFFTNPVVSPGAARFVVGYGGDVRLLDTSGASVDTEALTSGANWSFTSLDGSAWGANGYNTLVKATPSALSQPTCSTRAAIAQVGVFTGSRAMPKPVYVAVQTPDNRLVAAGFRGSSDGPNGTATTPATMFFSQPNDPTRWDETEFEIVGDSNDPITGLANWGDYLIVFKAQEWYTFYGNSVRTQDTTGLAVFNYRRVEAGCTVVSSVAGSRALYLLDTDGNIRTTTGGVPQIIFNGDTAKYNPVAGQGFRAGRFIGLPVSGSRSGYLVLDEASGRVFFWTLGLTAGSTWGDKALFAYTSGVAAFPEGTTDDGAAITASYVSPYSSWGQAGVEKSVRQTMYHGTGSLGVSWGKNLQAHKFPRTVVMRDGRGIDRNAVRGETLSYKLTGTNFTLNRLVPMLREQRPGGVRA